MGTFNSSKTIATAIADLDSVEIAFKQHFENAGYTVNVSKNFDGFFASITRGNIFKVVLGMKTSLNVEVKQVYNGIQVDAKVGVFGQQIIPSVISMLFFWPVILTQIGGLVSQAKLDDEAIHVIEDAVRVAEGQPGYNPAQVRQAPRQLPNTLVLQAPDQRTALPPPQAETEQRQARPGKRFCTACGTALEAGVRFCGSCGAPVV